MGIIFRYNEKVPGCNTFLGGKRGREPRSSLCICTCVNEYTEHYRFCDNDDVLISSNYCDKTGSNSCRCNADFLHERIYYVLPFLFNPYRTYVENRVSS